MSPCKAIFRREFASYFNTPLAGVFLVIFLLLAGIFTFQMGGFFERGQADLRPFFQFHPWLFLFLVPAIAMRLWAEERRQGTIEVLMTLPIKMRDLVVGKFLAAWAFTITALLFTTPIWWTASYLGDPDHGVILTSYIGSALMAGGYLAIGSCISALTKNQVIAFVLSVVICFIFLLSGFPMVLEFFSGWAPEFIVEAIASLSFLTHFQSLSRGVIDLRDVLYFFAVIATFLYLNGLILDWKKAA